ncbi:DNA cytosine methyltransferase [Lihuaxuella thermophila]|uniref:Cytosine-specific methyltransferase n=1 Tax=Lihuaxuella thermophila TaxID=1173111 RepID=A0A1H8JJE8_9BACL|nr:DNA (cytosine-5-)-methyltransferase [Lihuaxuella thermophila]SEN53415.1 DNA (cytosine-5)-methyltransferase 1 [Lihuaxuella thermophila]SEN78182.1 DNA (cytosine-5)-methyltransferase 1 [Lihuaxuella thermophila]SEN80387.1 DNA (cytosine-5)-methyltransferase 1 [Lihuaxuella thermophila]
MRMVDLFSGIGGISLAAEWAGIETVAFCEIEPHCQKVLRKHWPYVPIYDDVRKLTRERLERDGVIDDARTIDIVCGGFPCQPFSVAGKQRGKEDDRHLWPEMFRVIKELRPTWILGENVAGIVRLALDDVLADLESEGYSCRTFIIPACAVGAPHRRDRVWIVGHSESKQNRRVQQSRMESNFGTTSETLADTESKHSGRLPIGEKAENSRFTSSSQDVADTDGAGQQKCNVTSIAERSGFSTWSVDPRRAERPAESGLGRVLDGFPTGMDGHRWPAGLGQEQYDWEPPRVAEGVKNRVARLKALGNAVVPQQVYPILRAMVEADYK